VPKRAPRSQDSIDEEILGVVRRFLDSV